MVKPIFIDAVIKYKVWGYEKWLVSVRKDECSRVIDKVSKNNVLFLDELIDKNLNLFGLENSNKFPLLIKYIETYDNLSVQVHPGNEYALKNHSSLGKSECWYILDAEENAEIIYGHNAISLKDFKKNVELGNWDSLLKKIKVKKGDFIYVPSGSLHAIGKGIKLIEVQQNSDITYRLYDYNRKDREGNLRDIHINDVYNTIRVPHNDENIKVESSKFNNMYVDTYIENNFFSVKILHINENGYDYLNDKFSVNIVIGGKGELKINDVLYKLNKDDVFILPRGDARLDIYGDLKLMNITK